MTNKKAYCIKGLIVYLLILSVIVCGILLTRIVEILDNFNLFFLSLLLLNISMVAVNGTFLFRKKSLKDYKLVLIINSVYSLISCLEFRAFGVIVSNNLGIDFSLFYTKNNLGVDYGYYYDTFNMILKLFLYDSTNRTGFTIKVNLIMLLISIILFYFYTDVKKSSAEVIQSGV